MNSLKFYNIIFHGLFDFVEFNQLYSVVLFSIICSSFVLESAWVRVLLLWMLCCIPMKTNKSANFTQNLFYTFLSSVLWGLPMLLTLDLHFLHKKYISVSITRHHITQRYHIAKSKSVFKVCQTFAVSRNVSNESCVA